MASEQRLNRINELIRRELGQLILREVELEQGVFVTITNVKTCSEITDVKIYVSVFPQQQAKQVWSY